MFGGGVVGHPKQLKAGRHVLDDPSGEVVATPDRFSPDTRTIAKPVETKPQPSHSAGPLREPCGHNFVQLAISRLLKTKPEMPSLSG